MTTTAPTTFTGNAGDLSALRERADLLARLAANLARTGETGQAQQVAAEAEALAAFTFTIMVPCMLRCGRDVPCDFRVGNRAWPGSAICGHCSAEIDADVARLTAARQART